MSDPEIDAVVEIVEDSAESLFHDLAGAEDSAGSFFHDLAAGLHGVSDIMMLYRLCKAAGHCFEGVRKLIRSMDHVESDAPAQSCNPPAQPGDLPTQSMDHVECGDPPAHPLAQSGDARVQLRRDDDQASGFFSEAKNQGKVSPAVEAEPFHVWISWISCCCVSSNPNPSATSVHPPAARCTRRTAR